MPDPTDKKWAGVCFLCGDDIWVPVGCTHVDDAPETFIPGSSGIHNCIPGRILHGQGAEAYEAWRDAQPVGTYMSVDEFELELEKAERELNS
jgi:hypothetical protein